MTAPKQQITPLFELQADYLCQLSPTKDTVLLRRIVIALGETQGIGNVCLDLAAWCNDKPALDEANRPNLEFTTDYLLKSGVVGSPASSDQPLPLMMDESHRVYALRHFRAERHIADFVTARLEKEPTTTPEQLRATLVALDMLGDNAANEVDWQLAAVVAGATCPLTILCGGPGTGKTTTVAKLLAVLLHEDPNLRVAIAAPTGKAAARLGEALRERATQTPQLAAPLSMLSPKTLHRLLGYRPLDDAFRFGHEHKLAYDVVVVDEASMIDPAIFEVLCSAMPDHARLVLVGDKDQLAAVAAGQVLGDLCHAARPELGVGKQLASLVRASTDMVLPCQAHANPIANATINLTKNHRFGKQPGIGAFAQALMERRPKDALAALRAGHTDLEWTTSNETALKKIEPHLLAMMSAAASNCAEEALSAMEQARVLTAQKRGPTGASSWNTRIERRLLELGHDTREPYYPGCPILITSNDQNSMVWNGDLGVCGRDHQDKPIVWIGNANGDIRAIPPNRLPPHETAWAMTVHKAQGSEFQHVLLVLPDRPGPLNHASLIYTGVTRAKTHATVCANEALLEAGISHWSERHSGLAQALGD